MESAKDAFYRHNYRLAADLYNRFLREFGPSPELYQGLANSLAKSGQVREAFAVFVQWARQLGPPGPEKLRHLTGALMDALSGPGGRGARVREPGFACPQCEGVLMSPVTLTCGHTFCRKCVDKESACSVCGQRPYHGCAQLDTNILVRGLVEKFWAPEGEAARIRDQGNELFQRNDLEGALVKYDQALAISPDNHLILSNRSHTLLRLHRLNDALADADVVVRVRPTWGKGHYRRGTALSGLGRLEEALAALCVCVALDGSQPGIRQEIVLILQRLLARVHSPSPPYLSRHSQKPSYHPTSLSWGSSDCEDNSSDCEEDASRVTNQLTVSQNDRKLPGLLDYVFREVDRVKRTEVDSKSSLVLSVDLDRVDRAEFDCILCCRTLWKPVTTPCGHTYCWSCLDRCLDYSLACPLCMTSLVQYVASSPKSVTEFVDMCVRVLLPSEWEARRATQSQDLLLAGPHIPMFVCTVAFPGVPCPLFVYEPRYRNMVRRCMQAGSRQFGMAACLSRESGTKRYAEFGTLQEIRDCVLMADGCSIVTTIGARRFRVVARSEHDGYDTAMVEFVKDQPIEAHQLPAMCELHERVRLKGWQWFHSTNLSIQAEIVRTFGTMPSVEPDWAQVADGPAWSWWLIAILPLGTRLQVGILSTTSLEKRLRAIDKSLDHIQQRCPPLAIQSTGQARSSSSSVVSQPS